MPRGLVSAGGWPWRRPRRPGTPRSALVRSYRKSRLDHKRDKANPIGPSGFSGRLAAPLCEHLYENPRCPVEPVSRGLMDACHALTDIRHVHMCNTSEVGSAEQYNLRSPWKIESCPYHAAGRPFGSMGMGMGSTQAHCCRKSDRRCDMLPLGVVRVVRRSPAATRQLVFP